jgi:hypothetical protein
LRKVGLSEAGCCKELLDRAIVKGTVLPNIKNGKMKAKRLDDPKERLDRKFRSPLLAAGSETVVESAEISEQFARRSINRFGRYAR